MAQCWKHKWQHEAYTSTFRNTPPRLRKHTTYDRMPSTDIDEFRRVLESSKKVIVVSGAGLSAASGTRIHPSTHSTHKYTLLLYRYRNLQRCGRALAQVWREISRNTFCLGRKSISGLAILSLQTRRVRRTQFLKYSLSTVVILLAFAESEMQSPMQATILSLDWQSPAFATS